MDMNELKLKKLELKEQELAEKKRHEAEVHRLAVAKMELAAEELAAKKAALLAKLDNNKPDPEPPSDPEPEKPEKDDTEEGSSESNDNDKPESVELNPDDPQTDVLEERSLEHMQEVEAAAKEPLPSVDLFGGKDPKNLTDDDLDTMFDNVFGSVVVEAQNNLGSSSLDFLDEEKGA